MARQSNLLPPSALHFQPYNNVSCLYLLLQRHLPQIGCTPARMVQARLAAAHFLRPLLTVDEGEHPLHVGALYRGKK